MAWKVRVRVEGFGEVSVKVPRQPTKTEFADAVASSVTKTIQLVFPSPTTHAFHPVLGEGGYDWDHEAQKAIVREALPPIVEVGRRKNLRFHLRGLRRRFLRQSGEVQGSVDS